MASEIQQCDSDSSDVKSEKNEIKVEDASPAAHVEERDEDDALPQKPVSGTVVSEHLIKEGYSENSVNGSTSLSDEENEIKVEGTAFATSVSERDESLPPKPTSETETIMKGVSKNLIKEGYGERPAKGSTCFLHYRAWTEMTMHKFEDTFREGQPMELILGQEKKAQKGLAISVESMKPGESALFHVSWELGYGEEGNFSFPNVPPKADLIYEINLIGFDNGKEGKPRSQMTVEERIDAADRRRAEGNKLFKDEKIEAALQQYEMALAYMNDEFMFQLFGKYKDLADAVKHPCHLNMAACMLKLNKYEEAIVQCNVVLQEDGNNVKALFRRGKARVALGRTDEAREDFKKLRKLTPEDKSVVKELKLIAEQDKQLYAKQRELYKGLFGPPPVEKPKKMHWYTILWTWIWAWIVARLSFVFRSRSKKIN